MSNLCLVAILGALLIGGCAHWGLVEEGRTGIGQLYTVDPQNEWSSRRAGRTIVWTVDGPALEQIIFFDGVKHGSSIVDGAWYAASVDEESLYAFRSNMDSFEIQELFISTWTGLGWHKVSGSGLRPANFAGHPGFAFELSCLSEDGLPYRGAVTGAVVGEQLHAVLFLATEYHYFDEHRGKFEAIIDSIQAR